MIAAYPLKAFLPTIDPDRALVFFRDTIGLPLVSRDGHGMEFDAGNCRLRVTTVRELTPHPFTVLGWHVEGMENIIRDLTAKGVVFERYSFFVQDDLGIWTAPGGTKVAWFKDPDGNILSLDE
jgi:catechol 2,3-dioxygenase-like lactoylglutathione lyase family enzyme